MLQATPKTMSPGPSGTLLARRGLRYVVALLTAAALGLYLLVRWDAATVNERCAVRDGRQRLLLSTEQAANAATISAVATSRGLPERAVTIALATAMQESALENIRHGDRDSVGLFQQRPSQGWGTERQILDPVYAANEFYDVLEEIPDYARLPLTVAAQRVQRSGFPEAYAKHETDAALLTAALTGRQGQALNCTVRQSAPAQPAVAGLPAGGDAKASAGLAEGGLAGVGPADAGQAPGAGGRTGPGDGGTAAAVPEAVSAGTRSVMDRVAREFRESAGTVRVDGRTVVYRRPGGGGAAERGRWALAAWAVAHAKGLGIEQVTHESTVWTARDSADGWRRIPDGVSGEVRISVSE